MSWYPPEILASLKELVEKKIKVMIKCLFTQVLTLQYPSTSWWCVIRVFLYAFADLFSPTMSCKTISYIYETIYWQKKVHLVNDIIMYIVYMLQDGMHTLIKRSSLLALIFINHLLFPPNSHGTKECKFSHFLPSCLSVFLGQIQQFSSLVWVCKVHNSWFWYSWIFI